MKVTVLPIEAEAVQTTWDGQTRDRIKQWAEIEHSQGLRTQFQITSEPGKEHKPGDYELAPESFGVANGRLTLNRVVLRAISRPAASAGKGA